MGNNDSTVFWSRVAPAPQPEYDYASSKRLFTTANGLPQEWISAYNGIKPQAQTQLYSDEGPKSIFNGDYASAQVGKHARKRSASGELEPAESYLRRMAATGVTRNLESLAPGEREAVEADIATARAERDNGEQTHDQVRQQIVSAESTAGLFGSQNQAAQMRSGVDQRVQAATDALRAGVAYQPVGPAAARVDLFGIRKAEADAQGAAVATRYGHGNLRPSDGLHVTTS